MSATRKTQNYELPLFNGTDIPSWLVDWNNAMTAIDSAVKNAATEGSDASSAVANMRESVDTLSQSVVNLGNNLNTQAAKILSIESKLSANNIGYNRIGGDSGDYTKVYYSKFISVIKFEKYGTYQNMVTYNINGSDKIMLGYVAGNIFNFDSSGTLSNTTISNAVEINFGSIHMYNSNGEPIRVCSIGGCYAGNNTYMYYSSNNVPNNFRIFIGTCVFLPTGIFYSPSNA